MNKKRISKKGATHIDWVMSIGIFLIYLLSLFIIIKPGVREIYGGDTLLFIVENNIKNNVTWTIKETLFFIKSDCVTQDSTTPQISIKLCEDQTEPCQLGGDWKFSKIDPLPSEQNTLTDYEFSLWDDNLISKGDYSLIYYPDKQNPSRTYLKLEVTPSQCDVELGVTEEIEGLSREWLNDLQTQNYEDVKTAWGYPEGGEFSIYITEIEES